MLRFLHLDLLGLETAWCSIFEMKIMNGVELLTRTIHEDERGSLVAFEEQDGLPFAPRRIFYITVPDSSSIRAGHAGTSEELIIPLTGAVKVELDNGIRQSSLRLAERNKALWVRPGVWLQIKEFAPGTVLLVVASLLYAETRHYNQPQPRLIQG